MKAHQQCTARLAQPVAKFSQLRRLGLLGRLHLKVHDLAPSLCRLQKHIKLRRQRPGEVPAKLLAPAGGDGRHVPVRGKELPNTGQSGCRFGQRIEPELQEFCISERRFGSLRQLRRRPSLG